jgi:DNA-binding beta-propeller fold protein YncE
MSHIHGSSFALPTSFLLLASFTLLLLSACASPEGSMQDMQVVDTNPGPVWPPPPQEPRIQFLRNISGPADMGIKKSWLQKTVATFFGSQEGGATMLRPYSVFSDGDRIYVTDPGLSALHFFDLSGKNYSLIRKFRQETLISPIGVAVDASSVYLTDSVLRKVFVFDKEGKPQRVIGTPELFLRPTGIAADDDRVYVVDTYGHRVFVFGKKEGNVLFQFGKNGQGHGEFHYPTNISVGKDGLLYIADSLNFRIQIFDREGNFLSAFGKHGDSSGNFSKPKGIAVDSEGHIYVADADFDNIQIFDRDGKLLLVFGKTGRGKGEMVLPAGICIDDRDRIYVADSYNKRLQIFQYLKAKQ